MVTVDVYANPCNQNWVLQTVGDNWDMAQEFDSLDDLRAAIYLAATCYSGVFFVMGSCIN